MRVWCSKEDEVAKLKKKYQDLSNQYAELQLSNVELENIKTQQERVVSGLEKKNIDLCEENKRLEELLVQLRDEINRLDNERRMVEKGFINEIEKRDERYIALRKKIENIENKSNESELAVKECLIKELENKMRNQKREIDELNESVRILTNEKITLESKLMASGPQEERLESRTMELSKANEEIAKKKEEVKKLQEEILKLNEKLITSQEKLVSLQKELNEKEASLKEKETCIVSLKEQAYSSKETIQEQDKLIARLKTESDELQSKLKSMEKQCADQRKELETANAEAKELRSTLIAALENANKTENLRKVELEHAQNSMIALERQIDKNSNGKELVNTLLIIKSSLTAVLEGSQAYKAIYCSVSEPFRQLINKELLSTDKLQELPSSEQYSFLKHVLTTIFTEIKLLSMKIIETENKIIKLNSQHFEIDLGTHGTNQKLQKASRNPSLSLADSFSLEKENLISEVKAEQRGLHSGESSLSDMISSEGHGENMLTDGSTLMKTAQDRSLCHSIHENSSKIVCFSSLLIIV